MRPLLAVLSATVTAGGTPAAPAPTVAIPNAASSLPPLTTCSGQLDLAAPVPVQLRALRCSVNWARRLDGRRKLHHSHLLDRSALVRARSIRRCRSFSHTPCGQSFIAVFERVGYLKRAGEVGENLYCGAGSDGTARTTLHEWLISPEHRSNLLFAWRDFGAALIKSPGICGAGDASIWVMDFGRRG
ncbi:MAG: CAP domain-containing protein [Gaiellaceae bacterium]